MTGTEAESGTLTLDTTVMRKTVRRLLGPDDAADVLPPAADELAALTARLREHLALLMPAVDQLAARLPSNSIPRYCALACLGEARQKLRAAPSPVPGGAVAYARRLGRSLAALVDHHERLTGVMMCLACDQLIREDEESRPYDQVSPSGGAVRSGRIHARCANTVRRH
ncbi:DUF6415 family natural product biosynthesis protein [Streptomyces caeni]|uniref:DUF6415 family natural product biosynthesis protein n=1 Tax=Streptomyces caeni TaxID=2307231 RepID=A0ABW4II64_9ACTN